MQLLGLTKRQKKEKFNKELSEIVKNYFYQGKKDKVILLYLQKQNINIR